MSNRKSQSGRRGFVAITTAVIIIGLLAFAGLAIDIGYLELTRRRAQVAVDAAAMGAGLEAQRGATAAVLVEAARSDSALNGFTNGIDSTTVVVNHPPLSGRLAGSTRAVEAVVTRSVPTFFLGVVGQNGATVRARAVGLVGAGTACIFALNKHLTGSLTVSGNADANSACDALVSSDHPTSAFNMNGGTRLNMGNHSRVGVVGGWSSPDVWDTIDNLPAEPTHTIDRGDPLAHVVAPTSGILQFGGAKLPKVQPHETVNLSPGVYCGGWDILGTANLASGTYILAGGYDGMKIGAQAVLSGTGVTIYNTTSASANWGCPHPRLDDYGAVSIAGGATVNISAPISGSLAGIAFFQDRTVTSTSDEKFIGGSGMIIDGAIYFSKSPLKFTGSSSDAGYTFLVADTVDIGGGSTLKNNTSSLPDGSPLRAVATVAE